MKLKLLKATAGIAAFAAIAVAAPVGPASAADPGFGPQGTITLSAPSGTSSTPFTMTLSGTILDQVCQGDSTASYRWQTFITPVGNIVPTTWTTSGIPSGPAFTNSLAVNGGNFVRSQNPGLGDGLVAPSQTFSFSNAGFGGVNGLAANPGQYNVGVACTLPDGGGVVQTTRYWSTSIWIAPATGAGANGFIYGQLAAPVAPTIGAPTLTPAAPAAPTTATVPFTIPPTIDDLNGFNATVVETTGAGVVQAPTNPAVAYGGTQAFATTSGSFTFPVNLGSTYAISLTASNGVGTGPAGTRTFGPVVFTAPQPIPITVLDPFERAGFNIGWTAPATSPPVPAPTDYTVEIRTASPTPGAPTVVTTFSNVAGTTLAVPASPALPALPTYPAGNYTVRVTPNYPAGSGVTATAGNQAFSVRPNTLIIQEITVTRPAGALILTQRCGVYGPLAAFTGLETFPGFPVRPTAPASPVTNPWTGSLVALGASADQVGTSPDINPTLGGLQVDPEFDNYPDPLPVTYPTECGLSMGTARFVTGGALAGQFYTATGRLNQVTVLDTRDTDTGWIARGDIATTFGGSTGDTFSGDYLGWVPVVTRTSDPIPGSGGYDQIVTAGPTVLPGSNVTVANQAAQIGMTENPILAESPLNGGLGIASMDARMNLLIPASIDAANYSADLSLTVVPRP